MTEEHFTVEDIEDMIYQLGVLIADDSKGLLITTLKKIFLKNINNLTQQLHESVLLMK